MEVVKLSGNLLSDQDATPVRRHVLLNAVRRTLYESVPRRAITDVVVVRNTGIVFDDMLRHRLGLVPVADDGPEHWGLSVCWDSDATAWVVNEQVTDKSADRLTITTHMFNPPLGVFDMPITVLQRGQELGVTCSATKGTGSDDAQFCPVNTVTVDVDTCEVHLETVDGGPGIDLVRTALEKLAARVRSVCAQF